MSSISSKKRKKQVNLKYRCSKVECIRLFFGRIHGLTICFRVLLTFKIGLYFEAFRNRCTSFIFSGRFSRLGQTLVFRKVTVEKEWLSRLKIKFIFSKKVKKRNDEISQFFFDVTILPKKTGRY